MVANVARKINPRPLDPVRRTLPGDEPLDERAGFLGMGRSISFPYPQWRAKDPYRTVFFDVGEGPSTIVMVHGLGANATHFEPVVRRMANRHRVIGLDLVGCGWSRKPKVDYNVELLRDHLLDFLDRRGIGRCTLVGHSMGGAISLAAALKRPGQFDGLALLCAAGVAPLPRWMRAGARFALKKEILLPSLVLGSSFIVRNVFVTRARENDSDQLKHLHMPVLALWGDHDKLTAVPSVMRSLDNIHSVRTVMLKRCGHMPMIEYPEQTAWHLERFISTPP